jgi:hypothetical protein
VESEAGQKTSQNSEESGSGKDVKFRAFWAVHALGSAKYLLNF